ncbi:hypothetical protein F5050DRAFT_1839550, partial [Lentinula boryana]
LTSRIESLKKQLATSGIANAVKFPEKRCRNCQRQGHLAEECFRKGGGKEGQYPSWWRGKKENATGNPSANTTMSTTESNHEALPEVGELMQYYGLVAAAFDSGEGQEIYADTGTSDHFFKRRADFVTY